MEDYTDVSEKQAAAVRKLIEQLKKDKILLFPSDLNNPQLRNITFVKNVNGINKRIFMSQHSFYRDSGMMQITRTKKDSNGNDTNWTEVIPLTDDDWLQKFIKPIIYKLLEVS